MSKAKKFDINDISELQHKLIDEAYTTFKDKAGNVLRVETIATHSGKPINHRLYRGPYMKDACATWCTKLGAETDKPFIKNHDSWSEPIGRVVDAQYKSLARGQKFTKDYLFPTKQGSGFIKLFSDIMDEDAIEKMLDGRYTTVSVGGSTNAAYCNICSKEAGQFVNMWGHYEDKDGEKHYCEHIPGRTYKDQKCLVITGELEYHEVSQVNIPADSDAKHVSKQMLKDSVGNENSLWSFFADSEEGDEFEILQLPTRFSILDAEGNPIRSLDTDKYESTKTISVPSNPKIHDTYGLESEGEESETQSTLTDEAFFNAQVLKHFSDLDMLDLEDSEKEEVEKLGTAELSDSQSEVLDQVFMTHPSVGFEVADQKQLEITRSLIKEGRLTVKDSERWIKAVDEELSTNFSNSSSEDTTMGDEALKKALAAAQKTVEDLQAENAEHVKTIADLKSKNESLETQNKEFSDKLNGQTVDRVIELRSKLGYHDCKDLDAAKTKEVKEKYMKKSPEVISDMYEDLTAQEADGGFVSNSVNDAAEEPVSNPLEEKPDADIQDDATPAAPAAPAAKSFKDNSDF